MPYHDELKKIGLSEKESAVYQAALGLGPSTVQIIARHAKVARGTTYVVLEALMDQGLISKYNEGKTTLFVASPPRQLVRLLDRREEELRQYRTDLNRLLPELHAYMKGSNGKPNVRYYGGPEGLRAMRYEMARASRPGDTWYNFTPADYLHDVFGDGDFLFDKTRLARAIYSKTIFTTSSAERKNDILAIPYRKRIQRKFIPPEEFRGKSGITIYRDRVAIGNLTGTIGGVIIESRATADTMRDFFEALWKRL